VPRLRSCSAGLDGIQKGCVSQPGACGLAKPDPRPRLAGKMTVHATELLNERALSKLKWRCRRGLLENDLLIERFFARHETTLTVRQAKGMNDLMELSDNDLLDLLLKRKERQALVDESAQVFASTPEAIEVLALLRPAHPAPLIATP
jgi:antitoxin CptB